MVTGTAGDSNDKQRQLDSARVDREQGYLTTQQGVRVDSTDDAVKVGERGPTLLEDFHAREKITHFDHERIPERVVHARGAGAYGHFRPYADWLGRFTTARFLTDPTVRTPVFVRFSTVAGSRGSADTVRDVRGFATKFYTTEGNYDLVGNNFPVFFIQDGIKFPDFVHAVKPEPHNEIPQAASAHDTLWDFVGLQPETLHAIMWLMSDRALPRSYRMMQGFGVHTFRLIDADGQGTFVKFHWKPKLGVHSLLWDECQQIAGHDPDFNRRDLWDNIAAGQFPEWELGVQLIPEHREFDFDFDLLDATKLIPEEQIPVRPVGSMVLDRNPDNFFAETEQVAFHTANLVPGIDFTDDPLLQLRNFSYLDTQLIRLGGPNFAQLPINRPVTDVRNHQQDGYGQHTIPRGQAAYTKNAIGGGCPALAEEGAFRHYPEPLYGASVRARAEKFREYYRQPRMFWRSMSEPEADHIVAAFAFELGKVTRPVIRARVVEHLARIDADLAGRVATELGLPAPAVRDKPTDATMSPALSQLSVSGEGIATRKIAVLIAGGVDAEGLRRVRAQLTARGAVLETLAAHGGSVPAQGSDGETVTVDRSLATVSSVLYDGVLVPGGRAAVDALSGDGPAVHFVLEAFKHAKPIGGFGAGAALLRVVGLTPELPDAELSATNGVVVTSAFGRDVPGRFADAFAEVLAHHRVWRRATHAVPA
ncbi:catalase [Nocardia aurantiaca]|uniref:Catalase n=1 Tax=Nocardia aurantiaca TaxID=2675850 RepID=A0A6I3L5I1_9NOCA|nr:catalase [Nocardia aurantiaca]MTE15726.1 catalase [Nocardia aurantiaca]